MTEQAPCRVGTNTDESMNAKESENWGLTNRLVVTTIVTTLTQRGKALQKQIESEPTSMISSRFAVAIHILALLEVGKDAHTTSDFLAQSIGTNAVVVRRIAKMLEKAGLIQIHAGIGGAELIKRLDDIRLLDVYRAVDVVDAEGIFAIHAHPHPACPVGAHIQATLEGTFMAARHALEEVLAQQTLRDVVQDLTQRNAAPL